MRRTVLVPLLILALTSIAAAQPSTQAASPPAASEAGIAYELPPQWVAEPPASKMRVAQGTFEGKAGKATYTLYFFGAGAGGSVEDNVTRWIDQIEAPIAPPQRGALSSNGLTITWVEVAGNLKASTMPVRVEALPGARLLAAMVEGPGGPWYVKVVGPDATVAAQRGAFFTFLRSLHRS
jgi:hypothetical protein